MGFRALLKGPTAVLILSWPHQGSNHRPCESKSISLTATLQAATGMQGGDTPVTSAVSRNRGAVERGRVETHLSQVGLVVTEGL